MGCNIEVASITYAIKARDLLRKNKFKVYVEKSTGRMKKGCEYSVIVDRDCDGAVRILKNAGIKIIGIN